MGGGREVSGCAFPPRGMRKGGTHVCCEFLGKKRLRVVRGLGWILHSDRHAWGPPWCCVAVGQLWDPGAVCVWGGGLSVSSLPGFGLRGKAAALPLPEGEADAH